MNILTEQRNFYNQLKTVYSKIVISKYLQRLEREVFFHLIRIKSINKTKKNLKIIIRSQYKNSRFFVLILKELEYQDATMVSMHMRILKPLLRGRNGFNFFRINACAMCIIV